MYLLLVQNKTEESADEENFAFIIDKILKE